VDELIDIECFDGSRKTILNSAMPIRNPDGKIAGAIIVNQDITEKRRMEKERDQLIQNLESALAQVRTLSGLLPICASCRMIRDGEGHWSSIETYIQERTATKFSHGICPQCMSALYPEYPQQNSPP
jgi:alpha-galactosidase